MIEWLIIVHVLGWVFWLGTDIGVFIAAKHSERVDLSAETRLSLLNLGMILDRYPRFAVPVVWGTGMLLMANLGYDYMPGWAVLLITAFWAGLVWIGIFQAPGSTPQHRAMQLQMALKVVLIALMGGGGAYLLSLGEIPLWLALKWFAYCAIAAAAITLERLFAPAVADYQTLAAEGASDALNTQLSAHMRPVYWVVLVIYAGTLIAGISGLLKPL